MEELHSQEMQKRKEMQLRYICCLEFTLTELVGAIVTVFTALVKTSCNTFPTCRVLVFTLNLDHIFNICQARGRTTQARGRDASQERDGGTNAASA